jgi:hypothetical protein
MELRGFFFEVAAIADCATVSDPNFPISATGSWRMAIFSE